MKLHFKNIQRPQAPLKLKKFEQSMQIGLSEFIKLQYPDVIFTAEASGIHSTIGVAVRKKRMRSTGKLPDMIILEPRGAYCGLVLELKHKDNPVFKKNGELVANQRVQEQAEMLERLRRKGYFAAFVVGLEEGIKIFRRYMNLPKKWD